MPNDLNESFIHSQPKNLCLLVDQGNSLHLGQEKVVGFKAGHQKACCCTWHSIRQTGGGQPDSSLILTGTKMSLRISTIYIQMSTIAFLLVIIQIVDICNDIFTSHSVFLDIQKYIVMHFGYLI